MDERNLIELPAVTIPGFDDTGERARGIDLRDTRTVFVVSPLDFQQVPPLVGNLAQRQDTDAIDDRRGSRRAVRDILMRRGYSTRTALPLVRSSSSMFRCSVHKYW